MFSDLSKVMVNGRARIQMQVSDSEPLSEMGKRGVRVVRLMFCRGGGHVDQ